MSLQHAATTARRNAVRLRHHHRELLAFRGDKNQSALADAHGDGQAVPDTRHYGHTHWTAANLRTDMGYQNNVHRRHCDRCVCSKETDARIHTPHVEFAAEEDYNGFLGVVGVEERRTEASTSASLDDNTKSSEVYHSGNNGHR